jgi:1,4-alpha-glucan branching enzyme
LLYSHHTIPFFAFQPKRIFLVVVNQLGSATTSVHSGMGANLVGDGCSFRVWAPNTIAVAVDLWHDEQMSQVTLAPEPSNPSYWSVDVAGIVAGQPYQFSIVNKGGDLTNPGGILMRVDAYARQVESAEDNARC